MMRNYLLVKPLSLWYLLMAAYIGLSTEHLVFFFLETLLAYFLLIIALSTSFVMPGGGFDWGSRP